jgi:cytochrome c oxidase subunit 2
MRVRKFLEALVTAIPAAAWFLFAGPVLLALGGSDLLGGGAFAAEPKPWEMTFQPAASETMRRIASFHTLLLWVITGISVFVLGLLVYVMVRFNERANPTPSTTTHNTTIEVLWTVIPIAILVAIAVPSFRLLYFTDRTANPEMTLKIVGHQWYWSYEYPDHGDVKFDSNMIASEDLKPGQRRLLEVDNRVVLPIKTNIRLQLTAADVIHAWRIPAFGVMKDAVPGRLLETWVNIDREGVYYGQCSELCGVNHSYMPIAVEAVSKEKFAAWIEQQKKAAAKDAPQPQVAAQPTE